MSCYQFKDLTVATMIARGIVQSYYLSFHVRTFFCLPTSRRARKAFLKKFNRLNRTENFKFHVVVEGSASSWRNVRQNSHTHDWNDVVPRSYRDTRDLSFKVTKYSIIIMKAYCYRTRKSVSRNLFQVSGLLRESGPSPKIHFEITR